MEYLKGHTLREYINLAKSMDDRISVDSSVHIACEVLNALKDTHKI